MLKPSLALLSAAALALVASTLSASEPPPAAPASFASLATLAAPTPTSEAPTSTTPRAKGTLGDAVAVSGHWVIEVREPDGRVAQRVAFDNTYVDPQNSFARVLGRQATPGSYFIGLSGDGPCSDNGAASPCIVREAGSSPALLALAVEGLEVTVADRQLELEGAVIATRDGSVNNVVSGMFTCPPTTAPAACLGSESMSGQLTTHALTSAVTVLEGQQIMVKVQLDFAAAQ